MIGASSRVSVSLSLALILGFGILALLLVQSRTTTASTDFLNQPSSVVVRGVSLHFQVDKSVYKGGDTILLALRNDSRKTIWLTEHNDGCQGPWWSVERLGEDGETWASVATSKTQCVTNEPGAQTFTRHTLMSAEWMSLVPGPQLGNVVQNAPAGTYRFAARYATTTAKPTTADWTNAPKLVSPTFTIQ